MINDMLKISVELTFILVLFVEIGLTVEAIEDLINGPGLNVKHTKDITK